MKFLVSLIAVCSLCCCRHETKPATAVGTRTYRMGFQNFPPRPDTVIAGRALNLWTQRADAAIISVQVPWAALYAGIKPARYVNDNFMALVKYYRQKNFKLWVYIDPANGLDRTTDAPDLKALGKSIAMPEAQQVYSRFAFVMDSLLKPDHLGLALETNLIRGMSPAPIYQGVKSAAGSAAAAVQAYDSAVKLSVSIQADYAWGLTTGSSFKGIDSDLSDFSFVQELGISSYPYFVFNTAQEIPGNYYTRLIQGHNIPVFVSEGGWSSGTVDRFTENMQKQRDYIIKQGELLDSVKAIAYFQLLFSDIDFSAYTGVPANAGLFSYIGLTDVNLNPKPALISWDMLFKSRLAAGN